MGAKRIGLVALACIMLATPAQAATSKVQKTLNFGAKTAIEIAKEKTKEQKKQEAIQDADKRKAIRAEITKKLRGRTAFELTCISNCIDAVKRGEYDHHRPEPVQQPAKWKQRASKLVGSWILYLWDGFKEYGRATWGRTGPPVIPGGVAVGL
jgi:hypothetical protein